MSKTIFTILDNNHTVDKDKEPIHDNDEVQQIMVELEIEAPGVPAAI